MNTGAFFLDRIICPSELRPGMRIFNVVLPCTREHSFIRELIVDSYAYPLKKGDSMLDGSMVFDSINVRSDGAVSTFRNYEFCSDKGIDPRQIHNGHQCFYTREAAQMYLDNLLGTLGVTTISDIRGSELSDFLDYLDDMYDHMDDYDHIDGGWPHE